MRTTELAQKVGLSLSTCHRRVKDLESSGAIEGYRAMISPLSLGLGFEALVFVTMNVTGLRTISAFEDAVAAQPRIVSAERLFGQPDYVLRVVLKDVGAYQEFYDSELGALPGVQRLTSMMVMKRIGTDRAIPTD